MTALQAEMDHWEGFGVQIEWFIRPDQKSALGIVGDADDMQILAIDVIDGVAHTQHTDRVEFSTGGVEI